MEQQLSGVYVPLVTPLTASDEVAVDELARLAREALDAGANGLVALGTTGEPATLSAQERQVVVDTVGAVCRERSSQFVVGVGGNNTKTVSEEVLWAGAQPGVTAVLSVVPYYTRPSEAGIVAHFKSLARISTVPLILYNIPYRTGRGLGSRSLLELADTPNVIGLKQAVGGVDVDTMELCSSSPDGFSVMCGDDPFIFSILALGGSGAIAASSHVLTSAFVRMVSSARQGEYDTARRIGNALLPVCQALFSEPSPSVIKGVLAAQGRIGTPNLRLPMTSASRASVDAAVSAISTAEEELSQLV